MSNEVLCAVIIFKVSSHFVQVIIGRHFNLVSVPDPLRLSGQRRERSGLKPINYSLLAFSLRNFAKLIKERGSLLILLMVRYQCSTWGIFSPKLARKWLHAHGVSTVVKRQTNNFQSSLFIWWFAELILLRNCTQLKIVKKKTSYDH